MEMITKDLADKGHKTKSSHHPTFSATVEGHTAPRFDIVFNRVLAPTRGREETGSEDRDITLSGLIVFTDR